MTHNGDGAMTFRTIRALRGPNVWCADPVLEAWVELGEPAGAAEALLAAALDFQAAGGQAVGSGWVRPAGPGVVRIAITYAVIGAIFGEYVGAKEGLALYMKQHQFATAAVMAAIAVTAALSIALFALTALVERLALPWYYAQDRGK